jgi:small-conductance mechanosensitive channel
MDVEILGLKIPVDVIIGYLVIAGTIAASIIIALIFRHLMRRSIARRFPNYIYVPLEKTIFYGIIILGSIAAIRPLGLDLSGLLLAGGIIGIVIGFASQTVVSNLLSGLFLFIDRPLKIGDPVRVEDIEGRVVDISMFSTKIRAWDGYIVRVPNDKVFNSIITNFERTPVRRIAFKIGVSYNTDLEKAKKAIMRAIEEHPFALITPSPEVFIDSFGENAIILSVRCWAPASVWFATKKDLIGAIKKELDKEGIVIPLPHRVLVFPEDVSVKLKPEK